MATADDLWNDLVKKRPALADPTATVTISTANLRLLVGQVHTAGHRQGRADQLALAQAVRDLPAGGVTSLFETIFGR